MKAICEMVQEAGEKRGRFAGVWQILRFNYPMFAVAAAACGLSGAALAWMSMPALLWWGLVAATGMSAWWALATLGVSHYVYDRYPTFAFGWLRERWRARRWVNVHAGFDQTSARVREALGGTGRTVDIFDPAVMTERSIHRARAWCEAAPGTLHGAYDRLPLGEGSVDGVFMLFAAHELRSREKRTALFEEARRALAPGGVVVMVEHLRGIANFAAFGPGVFHFHSRREWLRAGRTANLELTEEFPLTVFARCFIWRKGV